MLPPITHNVAPVTVQQDVVKPPPAIPPVTPSAESAQESAVELARKHPQEAERLREEQRRRQRRGYSAEELAEGEVSEADAAVLDALPRQGLWVDVEV